MIGRGSTKKTFEYCIKLTKIEEPQTEIGKSVLIVGPLSPGKVVLKEEVGGIP